MPGFYYLHSTMASLVDQNVLTLAADNLKTNIKRFSRLLKSRRGLNLGQMCHIYVDRMFLHIVS